MRHLLCIGGLKHRAYQFLYMAPLTDLIAITQCDSAQCHLFIQNVFQQASRSNMLQCPWTVTNSIHQQREMKMQ